MCLADYAHDFVPGTFLGGVRCLGVLYEEVKEDDVVVMVVMVMMEKGMRKGLV